MAFLLSSKHLWIHYRQRYWLSLRLLAAALTLAMIVRIFIGEPRFIPTGSMIPTLLVDDRLLVEKVTYDFREPKRGDIVVFHAPTDPGQDYIKRVVGIPGDQLRITRGQLQLMGATISREQLWSRFLVMHPEISAQYAHLAAEDRENYRPTPLVHFSTAGAWVGWVYPNVGLQTFYLSRAEIGKLMGVSPTQVTIRPGQVLINNQPLHEAYVSEDPEYACPGECLWLSEQELMVPRGQFFVMGDNRNNSKDSHAWGFLPKQNIIGKAFIRFWPLQRWGVIL